MSDKVTQFKMTNDFCSWCERGDKPTELDQDGALTSITGKPGYFCHEQDDFWWLCVPTIRAAAREEGACGLKEKCEELAWNWRDDGSKPWIGEQIATAISALPTTNCGHKAKQAREKNECLGLVATLRAELAKLKEVQARLEALKAEVERLNRASQMLYDDRELERGKVWDLEAQVESLKLQLQADHEAFKEQP